MFASFSVLVDNFWVRFAQTLKLFYCHELVDKNVWMWDWKIGMCIALNIFVPGRFAIIGYFVP